MRLPRDAAADEREARLLGVYAAGKSLALPEVPPGLPEEAVVLARRLAQGLIVDVPAALEQSRRLGGEAYAYLRVMEDVTSRREALAFWALRLRRALRNNTEVAIVSTASLLLAYAQDWTPALLADLIRERRSR
jgi:hypothetical protein